MNKGIAGEGEMTILPKIILHLLHPAFTINSNKFVYKNTKTEYYNSESVLALLSGLSSIVSSDNKHC